MSLWEMMGSLSHQRVTWTLTCFYYPDPSAPGWWVDSPEPFTPCLSWYFVKDSMPRIGDQLLEEAQWAETRSGK